MENINNLLFTEASVGSTSQLQNVTFLQNAFMVTFFTYLGLEGLQYFIGQSLKQCGSLSLVEECLIGGELP